MQTKAIVITVISCLILSGCNKKIPVPGKREDYDHLSGIVNADQGLPAVDISSNPNNQNIAWKVSYNSECSNILNIEDKIYFVNSSGYIRCYNKNDGKLCWQAEATNAQFIAFDKARKMLILLSSTGILSCFDINKQQIVDSYDIKHPISCVPAITENGVIVITMDGYTYAFGHKLSNGPIWSQTRSQNECMMDRLPAPIVNGNVMYCAYHDGAIVKLDTITGKIIWENYINPNNTHESDFTVQSIVQIIDQGSTLIISSQNDNISCLDKETGIAIWHQRIGTQTDCLIKNKWLFLIGSDHQTVACIKADTGECKWSTFTTNMKLCGISLFNNALLAVATNGNLLSIDVNTGKIKQTRHIDMQFTNASCDDDALYAFTGLSIFCIK